MKFLPDLIRKVVTPKPNLNYPQPIEGTTLIQGSRDGQMFIYDSKTNSVLFGGGNPDLLYLGRLTRGHIARKQEKRDQMWKTFFVNEKGNVLFGREYDSESLALVDSTLEDTLEINLSNLFGGSLTGKISGTEDTLLEFVNQEYQKGVLNFYDREGRVLGRDIPAFVPGERVGYIGRTETIMFPARELCFVNVDGRVLLEIKYEADEFQTESLIKSEVYELAKH